MGCCLISIGILSGSYHLYPVKESFQFDTTFMYVASVLVYSKVYQFRHPDATPRAYYSFGIIAILLIFETYGYYAPTSKNIDAVNVFYLIGFYLGFRCWIQILHGFPEGQIKKSVNVSQPK